MQGRTAFALMVFLLAAAPAAAASRLDGERAVVLAPNERVVLQVAPGGRLRLVSVAPAQAIEAAPPRPATRAEAGRNPLVETEEGTIALTLGEVAGDTFLKVENGLSKAFDYRAEMTPGGPTSVCTVLPLLAGYEHWPSRHVDGMVLRGFTLRDSSEVVCPEPSSFPPRSVSSR